MTLGRKRGRGLAAAILLLTALVAPVSAVTAADSPLALAEKALKAGKPDLALRALDASLEKGLLKGNDIAKAYYLRGLANAKAGNQAAAIADLNNALWLKGLSDGERKEATDAKAAAYRKAGVAVTADAGAGAAGMDSATPTVSTAAAGAASPWKTAKTMAAKEDAPAIASPPADGAPLPWTTQASTAVSSSEAAASPDPQPAAANNPLGSFFGGIFGSGSTAAPASSGPPTQPAASTVAATPADVPAWQTASTTDGTSPSQSAHGGSTFVQVALVRTMAEAQSFRTKLAAEHATAVGAVPTSITAAPIGNMGVFYSVKLGPVAGKAQGQELCAKLRAEGVDCFLATP